MNGFDVRIDKSLNRADIVGNPITKENPMTLADCKMAIVSKGTGTGCVVDLIHPVTGLTVYGNDAVKSCMTKYPDAEIMDLADFCAWKAERQRTPIAWEETTQEQFDDMLGCLPPAAMKGNAFLVGEPADHDAGNGRPRYYAYRHTDRYEVSDRPLTRQEFSTI